MPKFTHGASESSQIRFNTLQSTTVHSLFPDFSSYEDVKSYFIKTPHAWDLFLQLPKTMQQELFDFCIGKQGLRITYDTVFQKIFAPDIHKDRLESLLSAILGRTVQIIAIIPRKGSQLTERGSFVIMDILVQLDDGSYAGSMDDLFEQHKCQHNSFAHRILPLFYCYLSGTHRLYS